MQASGLTGGYCKAVLVLVPNASSGFCFSTRKNKQCTFADGRYSVKCEGNEFFQYRHERLTSRE